MVFWVELIDLSMKFSLRVVVLTLAFCLVVSLVVNGYLSIQYHHYSNLYQHKDHTKEHLAIVRNSTYHKHESFTQNHQELANTTTTEGDLTLRSSSNSTTVKQHDFSNVSLSPNEFKFFRKIFSVGSSKTLETEQFTILTMTYKRPSLLMMLIPHYCSTGSRLHKIIIIWNDIDTDIPQELRRLTCDVQLDFIVSKENKLTNRFIPYQEIETEGMHVHG